MAEVYPAPQPPAPKKRNWLRTGCLGAVALLVVCGGLGAILNSGRGGTAQTAAQPTVAAVAEVAGAPTVAPDEIAPTSVVPTDVPPTEVAPTEAPAAPAVLEAGQSGELKGLKVTLNEVKVIEGNQVFKPDEGKQFVVVDVTFENSTAESINVSSMLQMELKDETGQAYAMDLGATSASDGKSPEGAIPPADKLRGQVGYSVPVDVAGLRWSFKEPFGSGRVTFNAQP